MERRRSYLPSGQCIFPQVVLIPILVAILLAVAHGMFSRTVVGGYQALLAECEKEYGVDCVLAALPIAE